MDVTLVATTRASAHVFVDGHRCRVAVSRRNRRDPQRRRTWSGGARSPNCSSAVDGIRAAVGGARNGRPEDRGGRTCAAEEDWVREGWRREPHCPSSAPMEMREGRGVETWGPDSSSNHARLELPYCFLRREYRSICQPQISDDAAGISSKVSVVYPRDTPVLVSPFPSLKCV